MDGKDRNAPARKPSGSNARTTVGLVLVAAGIVLMLFLWANAVYP